MKLFNIFDKDNFDFESLAGQLLWCHCVKHPDEYSGYDIIVNSGPNNIYSQIENPYPRGNKPGDIVRDVTFLSYYIGPTRRLSWKELTLALGFYKDCLLPDYHDCSRCEDHKNCKAFFKDDPKQERCSGWIKEHADEVPSIEEEYKKFIDDLLNNPPKLDLGPDYSKLIKNIYEKTLSYELDKTIINDDGTVTYLHSDKFLDEHPERKDSPEFTEEELKEEIGFIAEVAKKTAKEWGDILKNNFE